MQISHFSEILKKFAHAGRFRKEFKMKIVVLAGGISTERDVSLVSGMGIYKALKSKGHQVMLLDVFLGYANEDWKNVFEKDVDWTASVGAIKDQNPDIDAVKALRGRRISSARMSLTSVSRRMLSLWHCMVRMARTERFRHVLI